MKRSDAILTIADCLIESRFEDAFEEADYILNSLEKLGALPPLTIKTDPGHFPGDSFEYITNEWEAEDDET